MSHSIAPAHRRTCPAVGFTPCEETAAKQLRGRSPKSLTSYDLMDAVYSFRADERALKNVHVWIFHIRRKLTPLGITIESVKGRGYVMSAASALRWDEACGIPADFKKAA